jgi:hypothetical protein
MCYATQNTRKKKIKEKEKEKDKEKNLIFGNGVR